ncbi:MAG TPA: hypothetical protein ENI99_00510 [Sedimenticola sp.]|nr:hypothetical protein [Sedimenticola sp.]
MTENKHDREAPDPGGNGHWVPPEQPGAGPRDEPRHHARHETGYRWGTLLVLLMATVFIVASVWYWLPDNEGGIGHNLQTSYAELLSAGALPTQALTASWNRANPGAPGLAGAAFFNGARHARGRLGIAAVQDKGSEPRPPETILDEILFELGQWNQILWVASQREPGLASGFWRRQSESVEKLLSILPAGDSGETAVIRRHLNAVWPLLRNLVKDPADRKDLTRLRQQTLALYQALTTG